MSKEQTPIEWLVEQICTDVEMHDDYGNVDRIEFWNAFRSCTDLSKYINHAKEMEKEQTNAKVLEALEREVEKSWVKSRETLWSTPNGKNITGKEYYETKVKPKYDD